MLAGARAEIKHIFMGELPRWYQMLPRCQQLAHGLISLFSQHANLAFTVLQRRTRLRRSELER